MWPSKCGGSRLFESMAFHLCKQKKSEKTPPLVLVLLICHIEVAFYT